MQIRKTSKKGLLNRNVAIEDQSPRSTEYFNVSRINDEFTIGKNEIAINGTENLEPSTEIQIEILDANGDPIYYEVNAGYNEDIKKVVTVYIYEDVTPLGIATVILLGTRRGSTRPDIRWTKKVNVNPNEYNEDQVRLLNDPQVIVTPTEYIKKLPTLQSGVNAFQRIGDPNFEPDFVLEEFQNFVTFPTYVTNEEGPESVSFKYYPPEYGNKKINIIAENFEWVLKMQGRSLFVSTEIQPLKSHVEQDLVPDNEVIEIEIDNIVNDRLARGNIVSSGYENFRTVFEVSNTDQIVLIYERDVIELRPQDVQYINNIQLGFIGTITGQVARASVYARINGEQETFRNVGNFEIEPNELLVKDNANRDALIDPIGQFENQEVIDTFFESFGENTTLSTYDTQFLKSSARIDPVENTLITDETTQRPLNETDIGNITPKDVSGLSNFDTSIQKRYSTVFTYDDSDLLNFRFFKYSSYALNFEWSLVTLFNTDTNLGVRILGAPFGKTSKTVVTKQLLNRTYYRERVNTFFTPRETADALGTSEFAPFQIEFSITTDSPFSFHVRNLSLRPEAAAGFSPDYTILRVPIDTTVVEPEQQTDVQYKVDLFDPNNNRVGVSVTNF